MVRGLYTAAAGMRLADQQVDVIANNLANVSTVGYKGDAPIARAFPSLIIEALTRSGAAAVGTVGTGATLQATALELSQGPLRQTDDPLDVALVGPGFFVVQTPQGEAYTRAGNFTLDARQRLVTADGLPVLGEKGPLVLQGDRIVIDSGGVVHVDGRIVDRLRVVDFARPSALAKRGANLLAATPEAGPAAAITPNVQAGFLEDANVNPVLAMVQLIQASRAYEADQRVIQAEDETLGKAVNQLGTLHG